MALSQRIKDVIDVSGGMFSRRGSLASFWQDCAEQLYPERADFTTNRHGEDFASGLSDSTAVLFRRDFGNFLGSILRPKGTQWFSAKSRRADLMDKTEIREFFERNTRITRNALYDTRTQFIRANREADHDYVTFGNSVRSLTERSTRDGLLLRSHHLRDCAWEENGDGIVDVVHRKVDMTARIMKKRFKEVAREVNEAVTKEPHKAFKLVHVVMPMDEWAPENKSLKKFPFVSLWIDTDNLFLLEETGSWDMIYIVSRWHTVSGSPYAYSPCACVAMPDTRTMQRMTETILEAGEKAVKPPLIAQREVIQGGVNLWSGGVTWVDASYDERTGDALRPVQLGGEPTLGVALRQDVREALMSAFYLNKLFLPVQGDMTAEEVHRRNQEFLRVSQPIIEPAEPECNGLMLEMAFEKLARLEAFGPVTEFPPEIQQFPFFSFTYDNPVEDAAKQATMMAYQTSLQMLQAGQSFDPSLSVNFDIHKAYRDAMTANGSSAEWLKDEDEAAEAMQQMQQLQAAQSLIQGAGQAGDAAGKLVNAEVAARQATG